MLGLSFFVGSFAPILMGNMWYIRSLFGGACWGVDLLWCCTSGDFGWHTGSAVNLSGSSWLGSLGLKCRTSPDVDDASWSSWLGSLGLKCRTSLDVDDASWSSWLGSLGLKCQTSPDVYDASWLYVHPALLYLEVQRCLAVLPRCLMCGHLLRGVGPFCVFAVVMRFIGVVVWWPGVLIW